MGEEKVDKEKMIEEVELRTLEDNNTVKKIVNYLDDCLRLVEETRSTDGIEMAPSVIAQKLGLELEQVKKIEKAYFGLMLEEDVFRSVYIKILDSLIDWQNKEVARILKAK